MANLPEPQAPHSTNHGQDIFNAAATNRPTASLAQAFNYFGIGRSSSPTPDTGSGATSAKSNPHPNQESRSSREAHQLANATEAISNITGPTSSAPVTKPLARLGKAMGRLPNPRLSR